MKVTAIEAITRALNEARVRYLVVGGIAVNAYGYGRSTYDLDLVMELTSGSVASAFKALESIEYKPMVPITADQFGCEQERERLAREKGMLVLQFFSDLHPETKLDIFVNEPFDFEVEYGRARVEELASGLELRLICLASLVKMKREANRLKDQADLENLKLIYGEDFQAE